MDLLKYEIVRMDRAILFGIHEQSSKLRAFLNDKPNKVFTASNGWRITYDLVPSINPKHKVIFIRGNQTKSNYRIDRTMYLRSNDERDSVVGAVKSALAQFVKASKPKKKKKLPVIFLDPASVGLITSFISYGGSPVMDDRDVVILTG